MSTHARTDSDELRDGELLGELLACAGSARPVGVHLLPPQEPPDRAAAAGRRLVEPHLLHAKGREPLCSHGSALGGRRRRLF